jgi:glycosyltransferase involved in cell wall biosynthesis
MQLSIIIPTLNEANNIIKLVMYLKQHWGDSIHEIIVVDGWSTDNTTTLAQQSWAQVFSCTPSRPKQMNLWASHATGQMLRFVHADVIPPTSFAQDMSEWCEQWYTAWCFMTRYDTDNPTLLSSTTNWTQYDHWIWRMGGQTIWMLASDFVRLWWYDERLLICEEVDLFRKLYRDPQITFKNIHKEILVSARKYEENGIRKTNTIYVSLYLMYRLGISQHIMMRRYKRMIKSDNLATAQQYKQ